MAGLSMPSVFIGDTDRSVQQAIDDILLRVECREEHEWGGQVHYLPL